MSPQFIIFMLKFSFLCWRISLCNWNAREFLHSFIDHVN